MKYCDKCRVTIRGNEELCPLCQNRLTGAGEEDIYPEVPTIYRQFEMFFKLLILATILVGVVCVAVNLVFPQSGYWSAFAVLGILCFWVSLAYAVRRKDNIPRNITVQVVILSLFSIGWDWFTGWHGWSLDFVLPIACIAAMVSLSIIARVTKMPAGDYIVYLIVDIMFGIVPIIFYLTGIIGIVIPSVICIALSILSLSALILFEGKNMLQEIVKNFHL
jgi:hypothetical protein